MSELLGQNWWLLAIALVIGLVVAWWLFVARRRTRIDLDRRDTLDEGAERAQRNQALIDAPRKPEGIISAPPPTPVQVPVAAPPPPPVKAPEPAPVVAAEPTAAPPPAAKPKPAAKKATRALAKKPAPAPAPAKKAKPAAKKPTPARRPAAVPAPAPAPPVAEVELVPPPTPEGLAGVGVAIQAEAAPAPAPRNDLSLLKGVGPKLVVMLHQLGVTGFDDIAGWSEADIDRIDAQLEQFQGRIRRDQWIEQARLLAAGDIAGFEARFGKL